MTKEMRYLLYLFINIRKQGYIKNIKNGKNGSGFTFEKLLGKNGDNLPFPDFNGIEIKVKNQSSKFPVHLICIEPDHLFDTYNLVSNYGYNPKGKTLTYFYVNVGTKEKTRFLKNYFQLKIDYKNKIIKLLIYDYNHRIIDDSITWDFRYIYSKIKVKLNVLALITSKTKIIENEEHYLYSSLQFYKDINITKFIEAIENGIITIQFTININKNTDKINNHGTVFVINKENLDKIYDTLY